MGKDGCAVHDCTPSKTDSRHRFPLPRKTVLFALWLNAVANDILKTLPQEEVHRRYKVCGKHFKKCDFSCSGRLKEGVIPTLHLPNIADNTGHIMHDHSYPFVEKTLSQEESPSELLGLEASGSSEINFNMTTKKDSNGLLEEIGVRFQKDLTPKAQKMYRKASYLRRQHSAIRKKLNNVRKKLFSCKNNIVQNAFATVTSKFSNTVKDFFHCQLRNGDRKEKARRYTLQDKMLSLAIFKQSASAYRLLSRIFAMPTRTTLQKVLNRIIIHPGIHDVIFNAVAKLATKLKKDKKDCVLLFDEMAISPHLQYNCSRGLIEGYEDYGYYRTNHIADHVQVYMLRGISGNWKQPVGYQFVKGSMKSEHIVKNIKTIVRKASLAGFNVVSTVCDQRSNHVKALKTLLADTKKKYIQRGQILEDNIFEIEIDENTSKKVIPLFDTPHLLKGIRNSLLNNDIEFKINGKKIVAKWSDIERTWQLDNHSVELRTLPKLTKFHVDKKQIKKMKVSIAAQTLSRSVAAVINLLAKGVDYEHLDHYLPKRAIETAEFILFFDKLFDSVNGTAGFDKVGKPLRTTVKLTTETSVQEDFWREALPILKTLKISGLEANRDRRKQEVTPSFTNWALTTAYFLLLCKELRGLGYTSFKARNFQQDALENFFGRIRAKGFRNTNPTASSFTALYKTTLVNNLVSKHSLGSNCEDDGGDILFTMEHFMEDNTRTEDTKEVEQIKKLKLSVPQNMEKQALGYVGGYLLKIKGKLIQCADCKFNVIAREGEQNDYNDFVHHKEYDSKRRLKYCNRVFLHNLSEAYVAIKYIIRKYGHKPNVLEIAKTYVKANVDFNFIRCPHALQLENSLINHFSKLILNNHCNGVNKIITGRDVRPVPTTASEIFLEAKNIFLKKVTRYK